MSGYSDLLGQSQIISDYAAISDVIIGDSIDLSTASMTGFPYDPLTLDMVDNGSGRNVLSVAVTAITTGLIQDGAVTTPKLAELEYIDFRQPLGTYKTRIMNADPAADSIITMPSTIAATCDFVVTNTGSSTQTISTKVDFGSSVGLTNLSASAALITNPFNKITALPMTAGQIVIGANSGAPFPGNITCVSGNIIITNGTNSIAINTSQDLLTSSSPTFANLVASTLTANNITLSDATGQIINYLGNLFSIPEVSDSNFLMSVGDNSMSGVLSLLAASNQLVFLPSGTGNKFTITCSNPFADRLLTISDPGLNTSFAFVGGSQTFTSKTLTTPTINSATVSGTFTGDLIINNSLYSFRNSDNAALLTKWITTGDTGYRCAIDASGKFVFGNGTTGDLLVSRTGTKTLSITDTSAGAATLIVNTLTATNISTFTTTTATITTLGNTTFNGTTINGTTGNITTVKSTSLVANGTTVSTNYPLTITGGTSGAHELMKLRNFSGTDKWHWSLVSGTGLMLTETGVADNRIFFHPSGNVSIGNTSNSHKLEVSGNIKADGLFLETSGGTATEMDYYQSTTHQTTWQWGSTTSANIDVKIRRMSGMTFVCIPEISISASETSHIVSNTAIPVRFRPGQGQVTLSTVFRSGSPTPTTARYIVDASGLIYLQAENSGSFPASTSITCNSYTFAVCT